MFRVGDHACPRRAGGSASPDLADGRSLRCAFSGTGGVAVLTAAILALRTGSGVIRLTGCVAASADAKGAREGTGACEHPELSGLRRAHD